MHVMYTGGRGGDVDVGRPDGSKTVNELYLE